MAGPKTHNDVILLLMPCSPTTANFWITDPLTDRSPRGEGSVYAERSKFKCVRGGSLETGAENVMSRSSAAVSEETPDIAATH